MNTQKLRKSKKVVAVLMTVMMLFAFATNAFAFTDTDKLDTNVQDAIGKLTALEIVGGYADGTFRPGDTITRAEFAKIATVLSGMKDGGDILQGVTSKFKDVKTGQWYTGWINVANSKGLLAGYPDGTFKPNQFITQQEVATVLMRIAGYTDNLAGPWPIDYINQATKTDLFEGLKFLGGAKATRGQVAVLGANALDLKMVKWSKDTESFEEKANTLLVESFKGNVVESQKVTAINLKNAAKNQLSLTAGGATYTVDENTIFSTGFNLLDTKEHIANVIFTTDSKGVKAAKFVEITSKNVIATEVSKDTKNVKLDGKSYPIAKDATENITTTGANVAYKAFINADGEVYAVIADVANKEFSVGVVKEVRPNSMDINLFGERLALKNLDTVIIKNGKTIKFEDIKKYDVLKYNADKSIIAVESLKSGKLEKVYGTITGAVSIDGTKYPAVVNVFDADNNSVGSWSDYIGQTVKYAVTPQGKIQTVIVGDMKENTATLYGIVMNYSLTGGAYADQLDTVTIFNEDGKTVKYSVKDGKVFVNGINDVKPGTFVKFRLNADGIIEKALPTTAKNNAADTAAIKDGRITLGGMKYSVKDNVVAFNVDQDSKDNKIKVNLVTAKQILSGDDINTTKFGNLPAGIQYVLDGTSLKALVLGKFNSVSADKFGFVKDFGYNNGEFDNTIVFYGDTKEYELDTKGAAAAKKGFFKYTVSGDTVTLAAPGAAGFNGTVSYLDGTLGTTENGQFMLTDETYVAKIELKGNLVDKVITDYKVIEDDKVYVKLNTETGKTDEALYVIVVEKN